MNILAERSFPSFFKTKAAKLLKFYSDWLDWTELPGNAQYIISNLAKEQDIDESVDAYKNHLRAKLIADFPERTATDLKLLLKTVIWLYRAKSSRKAYDFLFRVLYNSPAKIWHPRETMLRTSDGHWDIPQYFCTVPGDLSGETPVQFATRHLGWQAEGLSSGARAFISGATAFTGEAEILTSELPSLCKVDLYEEVVLETEDAEEYGEESSSIQLVNGHWVIRKESRPKVKTRLVMPEPSGESDNDGITAKVWCDPMMQSFRIVLERKSKDASGTGTDAESIQQETFTGASSDLTACFTVNRLERKCVIPAGNVEWIVGGQEIRDVDVSLWSFYGDADKERLETAPLRNFRVLESGIWRAKAFLHEVSGENGEEPEWVPFSDEYAAQKKMAFLHRDRRYGNRLWTYGLRNGIPAVYVDRCSVVLAKNSETDKVYVAKRTVQPLCLDEIGINLYVDYGTERQAVYSESAGNSPLWKARLEWNGSGLDFVLLHKNESTNEYEERPLDDPSLDAGDREKFCITAAFDLYSCTKDGSFEADEDMYREGCIVHSAVFKVGQSRVQADAAFMECDAKTVLVDGWDASTETYGYDLVSPNLKPIFGYDYNANEYFIELRKKGTNGQWLQLVQPDDAEFLSDNARTAAFSYAGKEFEIEIPAGEAKVSVKAKELEHGIAFAEIEAPYGIGIDSPTMHFVPGERIRLTNPDNGEVEPLQPSVWWHAESEGHYTTSHGFISDINAIQDNHYWQTYSYVVQSYVGIREWRRIVRRLLHPAGLIFFGEVKLEGELEDGNGIMKMPDQQYLKRLDIFFKKMAMLSRQAILWHQNKVSSCRLAQTHSITSDIWLHWIHMHEEAKDTIASDLLRAMLYGGSLTEEERDVLIANLEQYRSQRWLTDEDRSNLDLFLDGGRNYRDEEVPSIISKFAETRSGSGIYAIQLDEDDRRIAEAVAGFIEERQTVVYGEDLRDWFDIRPSDVERYLNSNSVLLFRDNGTLINPSIVDWVYFTFKDDIDKKFIVDGASEPVCIKTKSIIGTTLHPSLPMIKGGVSGNVMVVSEDYDFISDLHLVFISSMNPTNGSLIRYLSKNNEVLEYSDPAKPDIVEIRNNTQNSYARKIAYYGSSAAIANNEEAIVQWKKLVLDDFISTPTDGSLIFNEHSLLKVPDAWVQEDEANRRYIFTRNAWNNENGVVVSYSPFDFSYRIWIERSNEGIVCTFTKYGGSVDGMPCPLVNAESRFGIEESVPVVHPISIPTGRYELVDRNGSKVLEEKVIDASFAVSEWRLSYKDADRQASWFEFQLPERIDSERVLCFINGLLSTSYSLDAERGTISVDTVKDNTKVEYGKDEWPLEDLSLEAWVYEMDEDGNHVLVDKDGDESDEGNWKHVLKVPDGEYRKENWKTELVMVSVTETDSVAFGELTVNDFLIVGSNAETVRLGEITQQTAVQDIVACKISSSLTHAEIYILSPIEASRKLKYPWFNQSVTLEYRLRDGSMQTSTIWPFTYDNARLFPFAAHGMLLTRRNASEIAPDKEAVKPKRALEIRWHKVRRLGTDFVRTFRTTSVVAVQRQSETVDRILATWWDGGRSEEDGSLLWNRAPRSLRGGPAFLDLGTVALRQGSVRLASVRLTVEDDVPSISDASGGIDLDCEKLDGRATVSHLEMLKMVDENAADSQNAINSIDVSGLSRSLQAMVNGFWTDVEIEASADGRNAVGKAKGRTAFEIKLSSDGELSFTRYLTLSLKGEDVFAGDFRKNASWLASANRSSTMLFGEDGLIVDPEDFNWSLCRGDGGNALGYPKKWWSVPLLADKPVDEAVVKSGQIQSDAECFKDGTSLIFIDGLKVPSVDVSKSSGRMAYSVGSGYNGKKALVYSMGESWMMKNGSNAGYACIRKGSDGKWEAYGIDADGEYAVKNGILDDGQTESALWFDLIEYVGTAMGRHQGTIWLSSGNNSGLDAEDDSRDPYLFEIPDSYSPYGSGSDSIQWICGTTEIYWKSGDKRRFADLKFLDEVDAIKPQGRFRLFSLPNTSVFGVVQHIVDIDPRFLMVFIDGRYSPFNSGEWRYIKGTFFVDCEAERSVEVYIGNPLSYLLPDSAYAAPEGIGELSFNNLRVNIVPRHHLEAVFKHEFRLGTFFRRRSEVRWFKTFRWGFLGYERERWIQSLAVVQRQSETLDDILYWKQMSPNAWLDEASPLKWSNKSSLLVFDANGALIDPIRFDWHRKILLPWTASLCNLVEYARPYIETASGIAEPGTPVYTGRMYFPGWEYDQTEDKSLHTALHVLDDGRTEGRYRDLVESNWTTVYIDGVPYDYDQWYRKLCVDLHLEESIFVNGGRELSAEEYYSLKNGPDCLPFEDDDLYRLTEGENLRLSDVLLNSIQEGESLDGRLWSFQIEAEREAVRSIVVGSINTPMMIEVPSAEGAMVFVDGRKLPEGSYGTTVSEGTSYIVLDSSVYGDSLEHTVAVYWPSAGYGTPVQSESLCAALYASSKHPLWEKILQSACLETYDKTALQNSLEALLSGSGLLAEFQNWIGEYRYDQNGNLSAGGGYGNGLRLAAAFGLNASNSNVRSITARQAASFIVQRKPEVLPSFIRSLHESLDTQALVRLYVEWARHIGFEAPLVEQFREDVESRCLLFVDGIHVPVSVDSSGRIVLEINGRHVFAEDYAPASFELYSIDIDRYPSLRSSTAKSSDAYQGFSFSNLRTFKLAESNTLAKLRKTFDWSIKYFIRSDIFKTHIDIFMNRLGFVRTSKAVRNSIVELVSETIDEVIARGQMDPSAWAGLDFDIGAKTSRSSVMLFDSEGRLIDPADVDYANEMLKPKSAGKTVEILNPKDDGVQMARVYWPIYAADPEGHSAPYEADPSECSRYANLRETSFVTVYLDGGPYDIDQHFRKDAGNIHLEETVWANPVCPDVWTNSRANAQIAPSAPSRYGDLLDESWWSAEENVPIDGERLLLTDFVCTDVVNAGGSVAAVSIDAETAAVREVLVVDPGNPKSDTHFMVFVPKLKGALVFIDGEKQREESYEKQAWKNGIQTYSSNSVNYSNVPADADAYSIEFTQSKWKDGSEHVVVVYYPSSSWAARIASGNLQDAIESNLYPTLVWKNDENDEYEYKPHWSQLQFKTFNEYVQSRLVLFCDGSLQAVTGNADEEIFVNGIPLASYSCSSGFELYVVDIQNADCRVSASQSAEFEQTFSIGNRQKNWFMEHHGQARWIRELQQSIGIFTGEVIAVKSTVILPDPSLGHHAAAVRSWTYTRNNRDTLDNVFCRGSIPVRSFMNPSLYVERITKLEIAGLNEDEWIILEQGDDPEMQPWVPVYAREIGLDGVPTGREDSALIDLAADVEIADGSIVYTSMYVPETWDIQIYATSRENPAWFLPCERLDPSRWRHYTRWNPRLVFLGLEPGKDVYIVETLDKSMEGSIANTDQVFWLEKEFNKKSTLVLDKEGLLVHPDGLEWCDGKYVFPHSGTWTAQPEEAKFPAIVNEMIPDNIKWKLVMDLCLDDSVGYDQEIALVADACLDSEVAVNPRITFSKPWGAIANKDCIYWEEGEFRNWNAWLRDDDVFDRETCFVFVNGFKIPDGQWIWHSDVNMIEIPKNMRHMISRLQLAKRENMLEEWIHIDEYKMNLIDEEIRNVLEFHESGGGNVFVDVDWATWLDKDGFPVQGETEEIPEDAYILIDHPDPREGIIWPVDRIRYRHYTAEVKALHGRIDTPDYLGHDLRLYVLCFVDGRLVQCGFDGTTFTVPGWMEAEVIEAYVFELHDAVWIDRFNAGLPILNLRNLRDLKVC